MYKTAKNNKEKEQAWKEITKILSSHIRQIKSYLLGYEDNTVSPKVKKIMLSNMMAVTTIKDVGTFLNLIKQNVQLAGFVAEDIEQLIYTHLLQLLNNYRHNKISFLQFATFLLPRRVVQEIYKTSKDVLSQMDIIMDCTENNELINKLITEDRNVCEYEELMEELGKQIQYSIYLYKRRENGEKFN